MDKGKGKVDKTCKIFELPPCVMRVLLSYLDNTSLFQLSRTCRYFQDFVEDPTFWKYVDARQPPNSDHKVNYCVYRIHNKTTHLLLRAKDKFCGQVPPDFFLMNAPFENLKVLALERQRFNGSKVFLREFPRSLEELSLKKTHIKAADYFFQQSDGAMQKLRVLILDGCKWVTCSFLMSVSKYINLEIISAVKCYKLHLNMLPYLNVASYGCKKLKLFDCRFTGISHELLHSFSSKESVQAFYFQSLKSAELDYGKEFISNNYVRSLASPDERGIENSVCDESLYGYRTSIRSDVIEAISNSFLYQDPYPACTCNYKGQRQEKECTLDSPELSEDYYLYEPSRRQSIKFVCRKHFKDVEKLPRDYKEFFLANQRQFYSVPGINPLTYSDTESDSDSDDENGCCMYGMGRRMVLLSPGPNQSVYEEVLDLNPNDQRERLNVNIFIANPLRANTDRESMNDADAVPSTSRSVSENSINENLENSRNEAAKRKRDNMDDDQGSSQQTKKVKVPTNNADDMNDNAAECAGEQPNTSNLPVENCERPSRPSRPRFERGMTRHAENPAENVNGNMRTRFQDAQRCSGRCVLIPPQIEMNRQNYNGGAADNDPPNRQSGMQDDPNMLRTIPVLNLPRFYGIPSLRPRRFDIQLHRIIDPLFHLDRRLNENVYTKKNFRRLSLRGFKRITDLTLEYLKNLNMDLLDLTYTSVTKEGIENFLILNPNCRIVHPLYCTCTPLNPF